MRTQADTYTATQPTTHLWRQAMTARPGNTYLFDDGGVQHDAVVYEWTYLDNQYTLVFVSDTSLVDKCGNVYDLDGQSGVFAFIDQFHPHDVEWAFCKKCEIDSPFAKNDPDTCLVCGHYSRRDNTVTP